MAELSSEKFFAAPDPWGEDPLMAARNLADVALVATIDHAKGFALTLRNYPIYTTSVCARATGQAAAVARYLSEAGIGSREGVRRHMNERLFSIYGELMLLRRIETSEARSATVTTQQRVDQLLRTAESLGYSPHPRSDRSAAYLDDRRPSATALISSLHDAATARRGSEGSSII